MPNRFANGVRAIAMCDRCGQQFKLKNLKTEIIKQRKYELLVCPECWDPDQPQLMLGTFPVEDPQALRNPRKDNTYITAGQNNDGVPTGGSRDIQWGWNPVGGSSFYDAIMTPNYLVATTYVGTVTAGSPPGAYLTGVSATGELGNLLGPLPITGNSITVEQGTLGISYQPDPQPITSVSSTTVLASVGKNITMTVSTPSQTVQFQSTGIGGSYKMEVPYINPSSTLGDWIASYGTAYTSTYMFADIGGTYKALGYLPGSWNFVFGQSNALLWQGYVNSPIPSTFPGLGIYSFNNFVVAAQFYISLETAGQYVSYSTAGSQATFTWTGNNAIMMRDTYAQYPALPVGTEISAVINYKDVNTVLTSRVQLGTLLSMGYSSGTFSMTYASTYTFTPVHNPIQVGDTWFQSGITFAPLTINI